MSEQVEMEMEVREHREKQREAIIFKTLRAAMAALADRGLQYVALIATVGLFSWAMFDPMPIRTVTASLFAGVFIVVLFRRGDGSK